MSKLNILVGADPEIFMYKNGIPISAHNMIKGDKKNPFPVKNGAVQVDGMALEFNIDPASTSQEFVQNIRSVMAQLSELVPGYDLIATPVAEFGAEYINSQPPAALELGCEPDFNAWEDGRANPRPNGNLDFRTGAGHVHVGWVQGAAIDMAHIDACVGLTKQLDYYLGVPSLLYDKDVKRRTMYGAAGAFRPKSYGVEYRVLSNAWLRDERLMSWVHDNTLLAVERYLSGNVADVLAPSVARHYLANPNVESVQVRYLCEDLNIPVPPMLEAA